MREPKHDWHRMVARRLDSSFLPVEQKDEVVSELAAHLEEFYEAARASGMDDAAALQFTVKEVHDWGALGKRIRRAKSTEELMNSITKRFLLPGMAILFIIGLTLVFLDRAEIVQRLIWITEMALLLSAAVLEKGHFGPRTRHFWLPGFIGLVGACLFFLAADHEYDPSRVFREITLRPHEFTGSSAASLRSFYFVWLAAQVAFGALAAFFSRRAGGSRTARILAGTLPTVVVLGTYVLLIPITAGFSGGAATSSLLAYLTGAMIVWVMAPAMAVLIGATPFLRETKTETSLIEG